MTVWVIAGLLGVATGVRIGWAMVNKQSLVSAAMIIALGSLALVAALNWPPLALLIDTWVGRPNLAVALSQVALVGCAAGSSVMITSAASVRSQKVVRRIAFAQYLVAGMIAAAGFISYFMAEPQAEMAPQEYLAYHLEHAHASARWLAPSLYVMLATAMMTWVGVRHSSRSRRGRALFVFTLGIMLILLAAAFLSIRATGSSIFVGVGTAVTLLGCAMAVVAVGALLPTIEDWVDGRRELRLTQPLYDELQRRHADLGIGVRPRGPVTFRVAERLSLISDALYLEVGVRPTGQAEVLADVVSAERAAVVARWVNDGRTGSTGAAALPGPAWLRQPDDLSEREWILQIARAYRQCGTGQA